MHRFSEQTLKSIPNYITYGRVIVIPLVVWLLINPTPLEQWLALLLFILAGISDLVDGFLARKFGAVSDFGKLLDPLADKVLIIAVLVMLTSLRHPTYGDSWVPAWMVVAVAAREVWVTGLRGLAAQGGVIVPASSSGKWKTVIQMVAVGALILNDLPISILGVNLTAQIFGLNLLLLSLIFSYVSAFDYTVRVLYASHEKKEDHSEGERGVH